MSYDWEIVRRTPDGQVRITALWLSTEIANLQARAAKVLAGKVVAVLAYKGGEGKTLLALELSWLLGGVLVDFDWDEGGATVSLGYIEERYKRRVLEEALMTGKTPTPKRLKRRPDLIPCYKDFAVNHPDPTALSTSVVKWATEWGRPVIVDTHPGAGDGTYGSAGAANVILTPVVLATRDLNGTEGMCKEFAGQYPVLLIPNKVDAIPSLREINRLEAMAEKYAVAVGPLVRYQKWYAKRQLKTVVSAAPVISKNSADLVYDLIQVGKATLDYVESQQ